MEGSRRKRRVNRTYPYIIMLLLLLALAPGAKVLAVEDDAVIATSVRYDEERNISQIDFDLASVNSEKYEIDAIISESDQVVIYERGGNAETASYEVSQNGDYGFLVKYKESVSENNESTTIEIRIKDIQENQPDQQETNNTAPEPLLAVRADAPGAYPQSIALCGLGAGFGEDIKDKSLKTTLTLDPTTYKIKSTPVSTVGYRYHVYFGEQTYYQISVIKKGTPLTQLFEIGQKNELMNVKGIDFVAGYYEKLENYAFEEGDMIQIVSPEGRFYFKGSPLNDGRGNQIDYDTKDVGVEKSYNAVYEITKNGFKEIYNEAPTISGNETPLYGVYGQAKWSSGNALYNGLTFRDDRGPDGKYVAGGYVIKETTGNMNFSVSGNTSSDTTPDVCKAIYNVTDAMGRKGVSKERLIVQLPNIDKKVTIDEMMSKTVNGLVDFPGASINKDSKTVTLKSGVVINADAAKPAISIDYANGSSVKFINRSDGTFSEVQLSDHSTVEADSIESARILNDKSVKLTYKDKKTGKKVIAEITAEGIVTKGYPQSIQLCGTINTGTAKDNRKAFLTIDPVSYKITYTLNAPGQIYHRFIGGNTLYYKISVIKNGTPLTQLDDPTKKTELLKVNANTVVKAEDYTAIENFAFEEGDMLEIYSWGSTFAIPGELMIGSDGKSTVDYRKWCGNDEKSRHSVYQLTAKGIQEIYNEKPTVSGYETPLYGKYNQATWGHIDGQEEINHAYYCDIEFKDDRNMDGSYVPGGFKITKKEGKTTFGVTNTPPDNRTPGIWNTVYTVTDAWGRTGDSKTRTIVQLPNIDNRIIFNGMTDKNRDNKPVQGLVDFPGAAINKTDKTVTLPSGVVINADAAKPAISIAYDNGTFTELKNDDQGEFVEIKLPDGGKIVADQIKEVNIKDDKSISIATKYQNAKNEEVSVNISSDGQVVYPVEKSIEYVRFIDNEKAIDIPSSYDGNREKYVQPGQAFEMRIKYVNLVPNGAKFTTQLSVKDFSMEGQTDNWGDFTALSVSGDDNGDGTISDDERHDYTAELPEKSKGQEITTKAFQSMILEEGKPYYADFTMVAPEKIALDTMKGPLPLLNLKTALDYTGSIGDTSLTQTIAVITAPIAEGKTEVWNVWDFDDGTVLKPGFAKEKLGQARQFDSEQWQKLSALPIEKELKSVDEKYKVYDFKTGSWVDSNQSDFESLKGASDGPVVYGYEFTVKDSRREELAYDQDHSLEASAFGKLFIANMVYSSEDSNNYILAQDTVAKLSETQVAFLGEQGVKDEIKKQLGVKGITEKNGGEFELVDVNVAVNSNSLDYSNPQPKAYSCKLSIGSGDSNVATMLFKLIVTENSLSHNTVNRTEKDGASGFIVIPKSVELKRSEPGMLEASDEVFFADYPNATKVIYNLSVEKTFKLTKESDETNQIEVNTAADGATEGTNNQLNLGEINNTNGQGNAKPIHFSSTSNQINQSKGRWTGNVTFYLTRI